jgi:hypothetical protein
LTSGKTKKYTMKNLKLILLTGLILICFSFEIPKGWFVSGNSPNSYEMGIDVGTGQTGGNAATIKSVKKKISGFGTLMQQIKPDKFLGQRIKMTGFVKSENVKNFAGLWLRVDRGAKPVSFDNMQQRPIKGTTEWKQYEIVLDVPKDATGISFGALLTGTGQIWFDNLTFEIVDDSVKPTSSINSKESSFNTLREPENLEFEE